MTSHIKVRYAAVAVDLGHGLHIETQLRRDALGSLLHARVPVMSESGQQVGSAVLKTWVTKPDGSSADLEFDLDLDDASLLDGNDADPS